MPVNTSIASSSFIGPIRNQRGRRSRLQWTSKMVEVMLDALVECSHKRDPRSYQAELQRGAWNEAVDRVQKFTDIDVSKKMLQTKFQHIEKAWEGWCHFRRDVRNADGWTWNEEKITWINSDREAADAYFQTHPHSKPFRHEGLKFTDKLGIILKDASEPYILGQWAMSITDVLSSIGKTKEAQNSTLASGEEAKEAHNNTLSANEEAEEAQNSTLTSDKPAEEAHNNTVSSDEEAEEAQNSTFSSDEDVLSDDDAEVQARSEKRIKHRELHARRRAKRFTRKAQQWVEMAGEPLPGAPDYYGKQRKDALKLYMRWKTQLLPTAWFDDNGKLKSGMAAKATRALKGNPDKLDIWMNVAGFDMQFKRAMFLKLLMEMDVITQELYEEELRIQGELIEDNSVSYYSSEWEYANESV